MQLSASISEKETIQQNFTSMQLEQFAIRVVEYVLCWRKDVEQANQADYFVQTMANYFKKFGDIRIDTSSHDNKGTSVCEWRHTGYKIWLVDKIMGEN